MSENVQRSISVDVLGQKFHKDGFLVVENVFDATLISSLYQQAVHNFNEVNQIIQNQDLEFGVGVKYGFKEIVQRHPNRYEMPYGMSEALFDFVLEKEQLRAIVASILNCDDYVVANRSLVVSMPGCSDQAWHSDGPHMSATQDLPCHCFNVFIPLVDVTEENGPTEIRPESQFYTRDLTKSMFLAKIKKTLKPVVGPNLSKGSILLVSYFPIVYAHANMLIMFFCYGSLTIACCTEEQQIAQRKCALSWSSLLLSHGTRYVFIVLCCFTATVRSFHHTPVFNLQDTLNFPHRSVFDKKQEQSAKNPAKNATVSAL